LWCDCGALSCLIAHAASLHTATSHLRMLSHPHVGHIDGLCVVGCGLGVFLGAQGGWQVVFCTWCDCDALSCLIAHASSLHIATRHLTMLSHPYMGHIDGLCVVDCGLGVFVGAEKG